MSPEAPTRTNSQPAIAPKYPTSLRLSAITTYPLNSPTVHSDISNPTTPKPIAAGGSRDPPDPDANHPSKTSNEESKGHSPIQSNEIDSIGGTTSRGGNVRDSRHGQQP